MTSAVHDRDAILDPAHYDLWLDPGTQNVAAISEMLKPYDAWLMRCYTVSTRLGWKTMTRSARAPWRSPRLSLISSIKTITKTDMKIAARVSNTPSGHSVEVETEGRRQSIPIAAKNAGRGSSINGGELFFAALATCFCNDLYREAAMRGMDVQEVTVDVTGTFGNPGEPARDISYHVQVRADAPQTQIDDLIRTTDAVTEIQNTVRGGCAVKLIMSG